MMSPKPYVQGAKLRTVFVRQVWADAYTCHIQNPEKDVGGPCSVTLYFIPEPEARLTASKSHDPRVSTPTSTWSYR